MKLSDFPKHVQAQMLKDSPRKGTAEPEVLKDGYRSQLERDYAAHLDLLKRVGVIAWWGHECCKLKLGGKRNKVWFTPDFLVVLLDGSTEVHETKGFMREAAQVRTNVAAGLYPWPIYVIKRTKGGWSREAY